ncbi:DUF3078 domain-containing protein [Saccharicrinis sp. FJH54]|uniref:DUF3078 domain-containing protein n=1 Tax=Saccharicrinis sp. FJH54 TaxID=3344665 RepID=UPI0035D4FAF4
MSRYNRYLIIYLISNLLITFSGYGNDVNDFHLNYIPQSDSVKTAPADTFALTDSVKVILSQIDSLMEDSVAQIVIRNAKPYIPGKDGYIVPDLPHFVEYPDLYNFNYIHSNLTYDEQLKLIYKSWKRFDERVHFNVYRYRPVIPGLILNYYGLDYVTYHDLVYPELWKKKQLMMDVDTLPYKLDSVLIDTTVQVENKIWDDTRTFISFDNPSYIDLHWDQLPDPPEISDTVYMPFIRNVELDYKNFSGEERDYVRKITGFDQIKNPWDLKGYGALQANETFTKHWAKGGESSVSLLGIGRFEADYNKKNVKWENEAELKLGAIKQFDEDELFRKNDDRLKLSSKVGYKAFKNWYYTIDFDFQSQIFYGYDANDASRSQPISGFLSPAKTYLSIGLDYKYKKNLLSVLISPLTMKNTLVSDTAKISVQKYGVEPGKRSKTEAGAYVKANLKWNINDETHVNSNLYLFSNYVKNPQNIDVDWEGEFEYKFSHVFSVRFSVNLKYDDDEKIYIGDDSEGNKIYSKKLQIKQLTSVGFSYRF